jgi:hypothetical protein
MELKTEYYSVLSQLSYTPRIYLLETLFGEVVLIIAHQSWGRTFKDPVASLLKPKAIDFSTNIKKILCG